MDRRAFLNSLAGAIAAAVTIDPDKLLWTPGAKTIFIPPAGAQPVIDLERNYVWVNLAATRELGAWHDGLRDTRDVLTRVALSTIVNDPVLNLAYQSLKENQRRAAAVLNLWTPPRPEQYLPFKNGPRPPWSIETRVTVDLETGKQTPDVWAEYKHVR